MALFNNPKPVQWAIAVFVLILVASFAAKCRADELRYVQVSGGSTVVRGPAPVLDLTLVVPAPVAKGASFEGGVTIIGSSTFRGVAADNDFALFGRLVDGFGRFDIGLGAAYLKNGAPYITHLNFNLYMGYRFRALPVTLAYQHFSDAGTKMPNWGRDMVLLGWRFQ